MEIYVVQAGDTITSIAKKYGIPEKRLIEDNGLRHTYELVVGQCIVILYPELTYKVQEGDTLSSIADAYNVTVLQLLRNNPYLSDREFIYPGEELVISYGQGRRQIETNGYANPFISLDILRKTLPYLTYLSIFGYRANENADIDEPDDDELIQMAKDYQVAPVMVLSTLTYQGGGSIDVAYTILYNENLVNKYINNILSILKSKNLYGVCFIYTYLYSYNVEIYNRFTELVKLSLNREGYAVWVSFPPVITVKSNNFTFERVDYSKIGEYADRIIAMNYNWGYNFGPPMPVAPINYLELFGDYLITMIAPEKIMAGLPLIGYNWRYPYIIGVTRANALTFDAAMNLAGQLDAEIQFDIESQNPYYEYSVAIGMIPNHHIVWFIDARSMNAISKLAVEFDFSGIGIWNIMSYTHQTWLILNSQYEIVTLISGGEIKENEFS